MNRPGSRKREYPRRWVGWVLLFCLALAAFVLGLVVGGQEDGLAIGALSTVPGADLSVDPAVSCA